MSAVRLFAVFHLNLMFSSIEEEDRPRVMERCYWPLLELVRRHRLPLGIEAPGCTLEAAAAVDPAWIAALRELVTDGPAELVGSGYAQLIGPLVPSRVVTENLRLGQETYERLLGVRPAVALVNEQAYSASLVAHYARAGFRAIMMEWDNPASAHPEWPHEWRYHPQRAIGQDGACLPVLWNHSIAFQKLQRYAHGELELEEYLQYLRGHAGPSDRVFPIYGSDAEVFDFRPGRYRAEAVLAQGGEWARLERLADALGREPGLDFVAPSAVLARLDERGAGNRLRLEAPEKPIPVKKQPKYDLARWAITGRDDLGINTACWRAYQRLRESGAGAAEWRELCWLWSSDFRTHITPRRWTAFRDRLARFGAGIGAGAGPEPVAVDGLSPELPDGVRVERTGRYLTLAGPRARVRLNCRRGLAVDGLWFPDHSALPLAGSLPHGYFEDIEWSADQYTGFLVHAASGQAQVTDLEAAEPIAGWDAARGRLVAQACIPTSLGGILKEIAIDPAEARLEVRYRLLWEEVPLGTLRLGHVTLMPASFDERSLFVATHNGGDDLERFALGEAEVDHLTPVSHLVSCRAGFGATEGVVILGDSETALRIEMDRSAAALFPLLTMRRIGARYFCRITLSARELDDTSRQERRGVSEFIRGFGFAILPEPDP
jgi:hypothetical protein